MDLEQYTEPDGSLVRLPEIADVIAERWICITIRNLDDTRRNCIRMAAGDGEGWECLLVEIPRRWESVSPNGAQKRAHSFAFLVPTEELRYRREPRLLEKAFNIFLTITPAARTYRYAVFHSFFEKTIPTLWKSSYALDNIHRPLSDPIENPEFLIFDVRDHADLQEHIEKNMQLPLPNYEIGYAVIYNSRQTPPSPTPLSVKVYAVGREIAHEPIRVPGEFLLSRTKEAAGKYLLHGIMQSYLQHFSEKIDKDHIVEIMEEPRDRDLFDKALELMEQEERKTVEVASLQQLEREISKFIGDSDLTTRSEIVNSLQKRTEELRNNRLKALLFTKDADKIRLEAEYVQFALRAQMRDVDFISKYLIQALNSLY